MKTLFILVKMSFQSHLETIENIKTNYYSTHGGKNMLFKNRQKKEITEEICRTLNIESLLKESVFLIPATSHIFINYEYIKNYLSDSVIDSLFDHLITIYDESIAKYGEYSLHINLNTITISALDRYKDLLKTLCDKFANKSETSGFYYSQFNTNIFFYNIPSFMNQLIVLLKPYFLLCKMDMDKIKMFSKQDSMKELAKIFV